MVEILKLMYNFCSEALNYYHTDKSTNSEHEEPEEFKLQEVLTEPVYEEPAPLCKLQKNIAYEIPPSGIKTAKNEAYGSTSNT